MTFGAIGLSIIVQVGRPLDPMVQLGEPDDEQEQVGCPFNVVVMTILLLTSQSIGGD